MAGPPQGRPGVPSLAAPKIDVRMAMPRGAWQTAAPRGRHNSKGSGTPMGAGLDSGKHADDQSVAAQGPQEGPDQEQGARPGQQPAEARGLHARLHDHAEEAELGAAESRKGAANQ